MTSRPQHNRLIQLGLALAAALLAVSTSLSAAWAEDGLVLKRHTMAASVEDHEPKDAGERFNVDLERAYCFLEFDNSSDSAQPIKVVWTYNGKVRHRQPISVARGEQVRTWAKVNLRSKRLGPWRCSVETLDGVELGAVDFTVTDADGNVPSPKADEPPLAAQAVATPPAADGDADAVPTKEPPAKEEKHHELRLKRHLMAASVEDQKPVDPGTSFSTRIKKAYCFMEFDNMTWEKQPITVVWYYNDKVRHRQPINVEPGPAIKTWTKVGLRSKRTGSWRCEIETEAGENLGSVAFEVTPAK